MKSFLVMYVTAKGDVGELRFQNMGTAAAVVLWMKSTATFVDVATFEDGPAGVPKMAARVEPKMEGE